MIVEQVIAIVKKMLEAAPFDKTYTGITKGWSMVSDSPLYDIDVEIEGKRRIIQCPVCIFSNTLVKVLVPKNNWEQAQIVITDYIFEKRAFISKHTLSSGDLNDTTDHGSYVLSGSNTYTNMPPTANKYGILNVDRGASDSSFINQTFMDPYHNIQYIRGSQNRGSTWSTWAKVHASVYNFEETVSLRPATGTTPTVTSNLNNIILPKSTGLIQIGLTYDGSVSAQTYQTTMSFVRNTNANASIFLQQVSATNPFTVTITSGTTISIKCPTTTSASTVIVHIQGSYIP